MPASKQTKKCCLILIVTTLILAAVGLLVYFFAPWEGVVDQIPGLSQNNTNNDEGGAASSPTSAPTTTPLSDYQFIQCDDVNTNCCNGLEEICDLGVNDILWATSHNAMSTKDDGFVIGYNHLHSLEQSLDAGYRAIGLDVCNCGGDYQLCHGVCNFGARSPATVFSNIVQFLNDNPSEIIMINLQVNNEPQLGGQQVSLDTFANILSSNVDGFDDMLYAHDETTQPSWPTLQTLIDLKRRLLLFHFNGPNSCADGACPDGFHYWFDYAAETEFEFETASEFDDTATSCVITRGAGSTKDFLAVTSFVTPPNEEATVAINAQAALESRIQACSQHNGLTVNLLHVDFWSIGDLPRVVQTHNKALAARRKKNRRMLR